MSSRAPSVPVHEVNLAFLAALGLSTEDRIETIDIHISAFELPTMTVRRIVPMTEERVTAISKLRLREVTGDGL